MFFHDIQPFVRYARYLLLDPNSQYSETIPYDSRLFFCYKGSSQIQVKNTIYQMESGCILMIPAGTNYHLYPPSCTTTYIALNFDYTSDHTDKKQPIPPEAPALYNPTNVLEHVQFHDNFSFNDVIYLKNASRLSNLFLKLEQEYSQKLLYYEKRSSEILGEILIECTRLQTSQKFIHNNENIGKIINFIYENKTRNITNQEISELVNLHPNHINTIFKNFTGMSLHQYILRARVSHSLELLSTTRLSIEEIAAECGFCDIYHFSKSFKKIIGVAPSKYRMAQS